MSRFHRVDDALTSTMAYLMRRIPQLPAYGGALAASMAKTPARPTTAVPQTAPTDGDTPAHVVAAMQEAAILRSFPPEIAAGGIERVSPEEFERRMRGGG
jgi:hypothetical protein